MKPAMPILIVAMLFAAMSASSAQDDVDDVCAVLDTFLESAVAGDVTSTTECLHEMAVMYLDLESDVLEAATFLQEAIVNAPPPEGLEFGECEPRIMGDIATVIAPLEFPPGADGPPMPVGLGTMLIREDDEWRILAMTMLAEDMTQMGDPDVDAVLEAMGETLEPFDEELGESVLSDDPRALLDLCLPEAVLAGPWGPEKTTIAVRAGDIQDDAADVPKIGQVVGEAIPPGDVRLLGMGCAWFAINSIVKNAAGEMTQSRHAAIAVFNAEERTWKVLAAIEAPREE